ncbi:S-S bond formation pathway protein, partial [Monkeypox virus]
EIRRVLT